MTNNDILRRIRYALDISNPGMKAIFELAGHEIDQPALLDLLKKDDEAGFQPCSPAVLSLFLDGLIISRRGHRETGQPQTTGATGPLTNNLILRKLRIALELKDEDMLAILKQGGFNVSKSELSALFRDRSHKNYKVCGDQLLRNFLKGLTVRHRSN